VVVVVVVGKEDWGLSHADFFLSCHHYYYYYYYYHYQGEVYRAELRLNNRGVAAASNIYLKSNLPSWIYLEDPTAPAGSSTRMSVVGFTGG